MRGFLVVAENPDEFLAKNPEPKVKVTDWKIDDFTDADLKRAGQNRSFVNGQQQYTVLACAQCHQIGKEGINRGPNLVDVVKKYRGEARAVLQEILEPSRNIEEKYRNVMLELEDDNFAAGLVLEEDTETLTLQTGPNGAQVQKIVKSTIISRSPSTVSIMPKDLLSSRDKEQILDLLAYFLSGGNPDDDAFKQAP